MIDKNLDNIITHLKDAYGNSGDLIIRHLTIKNKNIAYVFLESVSSDDKISNFLMKSISFDIKKNTYFNTLLNILKNNLVNSKVDTVTTYEEVFTKLASGYTIIFGNSFKEAITVETKSTLDRGITESSTEQIIRGPKDSFTENHMTNLGLIRKRIKDPNLWFEDITVGRRTKTKVTVAYIKDVALEKNVREIKEKLKPIDIAGIIDSGQLITYLVSKEKTVFPKVVSTERPDLTCLNLLEGKIAILVENSPFVLIIPTVLVDFFHSSEDYYEKPLNISFSRVLRVIAFLITILTPALYIAFTTFNQEALPDKLLISLAVQRSTVPFPTSIEILLLLSTFELLRESDIRTPTMMGTAISIVGALVLGDAAVAAGIVSPIVVIIVAVTSISGLLFSDIDVINGIRWYRLLFVILSSIAGIVGFVVALIIFISKIASIINFGVPYLTPLSPFNLVGFKDSIIKSEKKQNKRPSYISKNTFKSGDHS